MKAHVVQAPTAAKLEKLFPVSDVRSRVTSERKVATAMCAAEDDRSTVELELSPFCAKIT
jgi:hypothetical protein